MPTSAARSLAPALRAATRHARRPRQRLLHQLARRAPVGRDRADRSRGALVVTAASKKKDVRLQVTLECTEQKESGVQGMSRYMTQKVRDDARRGRDARGRARDARRGRRGTARDDEGWDDRDDLRVSGRRTDGGARSFSIRRTVVTRRRDWS